MIHLDDSFKLRIKYLWMRSEHLQSVSNHSFVSLYVENRLESVHLYKRQRRRQHRNSVKSLLCQSLNEIAETKLVEMKKQHIIVNVLPNHACELPNDR